MTQLNLLSVLQNHFSDPKLYKQEVIQKLWSGYGEIARYFSPKLNETFIVKHIDPPSTQNHPRGWNTQSSHLRKIQSYQIEAVFYRDYAPLCDQYCVVPDMLASFSQGQEQVLVLTDLDSLGFAQRKSEADMRDVQRGVKWLAYFHGCFMQDKIEGLWPVGSYWHLATRQDEYAAMLNSSLKENAYKVSHRLNLAKFQTCLHGDAKLANFCFSEVANIDRLAAVDFQYVGRGIGMQDLAYFLGSCLNGYELDKHADKILDTYFAHLRQALKHYQKELDFVSLEGEWRALYCYAWADFQRFLLGWSPQHSKINSYMQEQTALALNDLSLIDEE